MNKLTTIAALPGSGAGCASSLKREVGECAQPEPAYRGVDGIVLVYGSARIGTNVIWSTDPIGKFGGGGAAPVDPGRPSPSTYTVIIGEPVPENLARQGVTGIVGPITEATMEQLGRNLERRRAKGRAK
jgi:hypothetical protein